MPHWKLLTPLAGLLALAIGCAPARAPRLAQHAFLPPARAWEMPPSVPEPPLLPVTEPKVRLEAAPRLPAGMPEAGLAGWLSVLLREADWHYQSGRKSFQEGDWERARREFDRAIDILLAAPEDAEPHERALIAKKIERLSGEIVKCEVATVGAEALDETTPPGSPLDEIPSLTFPVDPALRNKVLEQIRATASQLPLEATDEVVAYIRYFSEGRGRKILEAGLRRAGRYRALIQRILDEEGVPQELIHVAQAESGFFPRAVSRKRATGMWQFLLARGREYGLNQTRYSDDRLDPEKATRAAARHLRDLFQQFGDWYLALAAYNAGPGVVERAVQRTGYADFWELRRRNVLPKETANYVPIILAITIMVKNAAQYGLADLVADPPLEYDSVEITAPTDLKLVADLLARPLEQLRELNPALLKDVAMPGQLLHVPKGTAGELAPLLAAIPPERRSGWRLHRVGEGETLAAIARRYRLPERSIAGVNGDLSDGLQAGDLLLVPEPKARSSQGGSRTRAATTSRRAPARSAAAARRPGGAIQTASAASPKRAAARR